MTYAFLIALIVGLLGAIVLVALWQSTKQLLLKEKADHEKTKADLAATLTGLKLSEAGRTDEKARLEAVIAAKRADIEALEADNHACNSPALVRERLRGLLSSPSTPSGGVPPFGGVPK
jgi:hypothetical protein